MKLKAMFVLLGLLSIIIILIIHVSGSRPQEPNPKPFKLSEDTVKEIRVEPPSIPLTFKPPRVLTEDDVIHVIKAFNASFDNLTWRDWGTTPGLTMTVTLTGGRKVIISNIGMTMEFMISFIEGDNRSFYSITSPEFKEILLRFEEPEFTISEHPLDDPYLKGYITAIDSSYDRVRVLVTSSKDILYAPAGYFPDAYPAYWVNIPKAYRECFLVGHEIEVIFRDYLNSYQYPHLTAAQQVYFVQKEKPDGTSLTEQKAIELALKKINLDVPVIEHVLFDKHQGIWLVTVLHGMLKDKPGILIKIDDYS